MRLVFALPFTVAVLRAETKVGDAFPSLRDAKLVNLAGGGLPMTDGKVVLVDFWASWCGPCKASFPVMAQLHRDYELRGLAIVAIGVDEKASAAAAFWKKMKPPFTTVHDASRALVQKVGVPTMPTSYLLDRDGKVRFVHQGFHGESTERELRKQIEALLGEK